MLFAFTIPSAGSARDSEPKWIRVSSAHFAVLTDGGEKKGREASLRLEQMREIFSQLFLKTKLQMPEPLDVIALQSDEEYIRVAPLRKGQPISAPDSFSPATTATISSSILPPRTAGGRSPTISRACF